MKQNLKKLFIVGMRRIRSQLISTKIRLRMSTGWHKKRYVGVVILANSYSTQIINMTQVCVDSILKFNMTNIDIVIVESGPFHQYEGAHVIQSDEPFAYNKFLIMGIDYIRNIVDINHILILNNDVFCLPKAIDILVCADLPSSSPINPIGIEQEKISRPTQGYSVRYHLLGWALMIDADLFSKYQPYELFPEQIQFYWQDNYYADFIESKKVPHYVIPASGIVHFESSSSEISKRLQNNGDYEIYKSMKLHL